MRKLLNPINWRLPWGVILGAIFVVAAGMGLVAGSWQNLCATCPSIAEIRTFEAEQTSKLFASNGELIVELGIERRTPISINGIPEYIPQAVIAIEDRRFYGHSGFDILGFARAASGKLMRQYRGGGSTITQQLARNMFVDKIGFDQSYIRKLRELKVAFELEESYEKDQILESYLNQIYMGPGPIYGFQSAARHYLGKSLGEIDVAEAALLAAILNNPGRYNPLTQPGPTLTRRNLVLNLMENQGYLTEEEAERWKAEPLPTEDFSGDPIYGPAPYFEEWVRQILTSRYGSEVYSGGLKVYTTLDMDMQAAATEAMEWGWERIEGLANFAHPPKSDFDTIPTLSGQSQTGYLQGMFVALDSETGAVRAMIGGRDFRQSKFDRVRQARRQPGSAFKPFVYTAALAAGIPASHIVVDQPFFYDQVSGETWAPSNFDGEFRGPITLREALKHSINIVAIKLGWEEVGIETVAQTARRMGISTEIERFPSTTIGAAEVIPLELAEAYTAFSSLGTKVRPFPILEVQDADGETIWKPQPERTRVLRPEVARIAVGMLQDAALQTGANHQANRFPDNLPVGAVPVAGKTGTTNDGTDTWFMGVTPNLTAGVWFGMDRPAPLARGASDIAATGGGYAAPVWGRFMRSVYYGMGHLVEDDEQPLPDGWFTEPALEIPDPWEMLPGLTTRPIDRVTGKLWSRWCAEENRYTEIFIPGTEPTEQCDDTRRRFRIRGDLELIGR